jgi:2',3'-cyclic-nucleotide 2'-phosphodiesterase (5'-nucleotidase family)
MLKEMNQLERQNALRERNEQKRILKQQQVTLMSLVQQQQQERENQLLDANQNNEGNDVLVNQVGCYGINLGRIDFYFDNDASKKHLGKSIVV